MCCAGIVKSKNGIAFKKKRKKSRMYRGLSYARKSEAIFFTLDDVRLLRDFPEEGSLKIQVKKIEEKTYVFSI